MGNLVSTGLISVILLASLLLTGITVASVIDSENTETTTEQDYEQIVEEAIDEISTIILIKDQKGKVNEINGERRVDKIALYITPLVSQEIDISSLNIQLNNGETVMFLSYDGNAENLDSNSIFRHTIWAEIDGSNFGFISIVDLDSSLVNSDTLNDCSDNAYLVFELPEDMVLAKHDKLVVTLFPSTGISKTMVLKTPLLINSIVTFE
jgi:archaellin